MKEFVEKLIERLEEEQEGYSDTTYYALGIGSAIKIVKDLASEHNNGFIERLLEAKKNCGEDSDCSECPFGQIEDRCILQELQFDNDNGWISVEDALPTDCDNRFYMCIVENHEEDLPMFCQYDEDYGFGFWHDYYDEHTLGFVDSEFKTNEELGYEKVIAWQPIPKFSAPYKKGE